MMQTKRINKKFSKIDDMELDEQVADFLHYRMSLSFPYVGVLTCKEAQTEIFLLFE